MSAENEPILGVDFHPWLPLLASAGGDNEIKIWRLVDGADPRLEFLATLVGHQKSVNGVRFSPNGECLASVSDGMSAPSKKAGRI